MELRHIRSFLSLAKTLNFSRAAKLVHCSQPALSLQIQALENEIGVKLFERDRGKTVLTVAGTAFQREAIGGLGHLEQAVQSARLAAKGKLGVVRLGFVSTAGMHMVPIREPTRSPGKSHSLGLSTRHQSWRILSSFGEGVSRKIG